MGAVKVINAVYRALRRNSHVVSLDPVIEHVAAYIWDMRS